MSSLKPFPTIELHLRGLEQSILMAFSEQAAKMDEILQNEVARFCTKDNLRAIIANQVDETIKRAINDEINKFYTYGEGREAIRSAVIAKLSADAAFERG